MRSLAQLLLTVLLNAFWQIAVVTVFAACCSRLLRGTAAWCRHSVWVAALVISLCLPIITALNALEFSPVPRQGITRIEPEKRITPAEGLQDSNLTEPAITMAQPPIVEFERQVGWSSPISLSRNLAAVLLAFYALVLLYGGFKLLRAWRRTTAIMRSTYSTRVLEPAAAIIAKCQTAIGITRVRVVCSTSIPVPITAGVFNPLIILPAQLLSEADDEILLSAIGHELVHEEPGSDTREAVWRMPKKSTAVMALGNSSNVAIRTTAQFSDGDSEEIDIPAGTTRFIRRHGRQRDAESVKLTTVGPDGSMRVTGFIIADDQSFTSSIRFYDTRKTVQPNLYATNLRLKNTVPRIVLKNTSDVDISARPRFFAGSGEQVTPVELPAMTLRPQQVVEVDLSALRAAAASRTDFDSVSVQVLNSGAPGSLIGAAYSRERATQLTHDVPLRDSGKMRNATGSYPWRVDQDYSTVVVITNIGNQAARFQVEIRYPGGPYSVKQRELAVGETATFDLRRIRDEQQPDRIRKTLPRDLERGQFHWSLVNTIGEPRIVGRAEVVSTSERVSSSYSCPTCCPDSSVGGTFDPNAYGLFVDSYALTNARGEYYDCYSNWYTGSLAWNFMWTNNTSIATINSSTEELHGSGAGETQVAGAYNYVEWYTDGMDCYSSYYSGSDSAPVDVLNITGVTSTATQVTQTVGSANIMHFVTPKGAANSTVTLTAAITPDTAENRSKIDWEGATEDSSNPLQATVSKASAAKNVVKIKVDGNVAKELRVWVVWATISSTDIAIQYNEPINVAIGVPGASINGGYNFTHTIQPSTIITDANRPNLSGANTASPPGGNHWTGSPLSGGADKKWDNSRQIRAKTLNPANIPNGSFTQPPPPSNINYPSGNVEGNDDRTTGDETNDPYANSGILTGQDSVNVGVAHSAVANGDTFEWRVHFKEFTRLEIGGSWHRISDDYPWRIHLRFIKANGKWVNNSTTKALDNNGY